MRLLRQCANMTTHEQEQAKWFAKWLLDVGEGLADGDEPGLLRLPKQCCIPHSAVALDQLIHAIYPDVGLLNLNEDARCKYFRERAILAPRNDCIDEINQKILEQFPGEERVYLSADTATDDTGNNMENIPAEYLNNITIPNFPLHRTILKVGTPILLLRNLSHTTGLCNGTRLLITRLGDRVIEAKILNGSCSGNIVFIPRIALTSKANSSLPFTLRRAQFPIRLAFAMTINKSQSQSLDHVGLYLATPVFMHGQLYVALSRATNLQNIQILLDDSPTGQAYQTPNITYHELLTHECNIQDVDMDAN
jgi:ATP-dependent DNA helicase PIF1